MNKKYSDWLKVDLHIHTDWSKKTKENDYKGNFSVDTLKEKLIQNNVGIFSLTDHNIINTDAYKEYYEKYTEGDPLLLTGIELDIEVEYEGSLRSYHTLLIFNNSTFEKTEEISNKLERKYPEKGITNLFERKLNFYDIVNLFSNDDFFFIPHAHRNDTGIIKAYQNHIEDAQEMILLMPSALEKVKEKAIQIYNKGFDEFLNEGFKDKGDIPYIRFSDNHYIESYPFIHKGDKGEHSFFYLKGNKNYETIRLAFIDPASRIKSEKDYQKISNNDFYIEKLKITENDLIRDVELFFSPHLNVLIGGRSSGKSLMMNILGKKIDSVTNYKNVYDIEYDNILIKSKIDADYEKITSIKKQEIIYLNQGDVVNYFEQKKLSDLAKEADKINEYNEAKQSFIDDKRKFEELIDELITSYDSSLYTGQNKKFVLHNNTIENILNKDNFIFSSLNEDIFKDKILNTVDIEETATILDELVKSLNNLQENEILEIKEGEIKLIEDFKSFINSKNEFLTKKGGINTKKTLLISKIKSLISDKNSTLNTKSRNKDEAIQRKNVLINDVDNIFKNFTELKNKTINIEEYQFSKQKKINISDDVKLVLEVKNNTKISELIIGAIKDADYNNSLFYNIVNMIIGNFQIKHFGGNNKEDFNQKILNETKNEYQKFDKPEDFLEYSDSSNSKNNSPGYNSEKYLEIILNNPNTKIIFIDQPEDNLGNRFISEKLVKIIRDIKFNKQIFLVTHNPSIVVYGDAENIILAENLENSITYKQIVLEDKSSQKEICSILDGGDYIFDKRAQKYNIERIKRENK